MARSKLRNEKGSAILITLVIIGLVSLLGVMAINTSVSETELSFNQIHSDKAFYVAQSGARRAFAELCEDTSWTTGYSDVSYSNGLYSVQVIDSTTDSSLIDTVILRSTGEYNGAHSTVELWVVPGVFHPFEHAMFGKSLVDIRNSFVTDSYNSDSGTYAATSLVEAGDVGSNGNIIVKNGAFIGGDVVSSLLGGTSVNPGATVTGTISDTAPEQDIPDVPQSEFDWAETVNDASTGLSGSYSYNPASGTLLSTGTVTLTSGVYYFSDITLKNSASLELAPGADVTIYITGDIELKNSSEMNTTGDSGDLIIYSQGDFILKNSGDVAAVFYSSNGTADLRNSGEFYGSIVADEIICHNSANFHYDRNLGNIERDGNGDLEMVAFREI
ncbi:MAG: pilus assembly PilX N-terminal domain-containing protein [candidate division Zixibacteria bacterium]|nr:pilus assembly PilX N-terminal domain-containing protein [candidate division Zixibacteria bacterium]